MDLRAARFAIYFTPRSTSPLATFGRYWLGRDAAANPDTQRLMLDGFTAQRLAALTAEPAHYGWHGTLKSPFRLAAGRTPGELVAHLMAFAAARLPFEVPSLRVAALGEFVALVPEETPALLSGLAMDCVRAFDDFRAAPTEAELARRRQHSLTVRQEALLARWGYPYVMEEFRFHMTLTTGLAAEERARMISALEPRVAELCRRPLPIDGVTLVMQPSPDAPFRDVRRFSFEGA